MRTHPIAVGAAALTLMFCVPVTSAARQAARSYAPKKTTEPRLEQYRLPAGSALLLKLRTPLGSASSSVDDQVEAVLWSPVVQDGVELIPEGSVVMGKVIDVSPATHKKPLGSIVFAFSIIEHAETGSKAMLPTKRVEFVAPPMPEKKKSAPRLIEAVLPEGMSFIAMTAEPLLIKIPGTVK